MDVLVYISVGDGAAERLEKVIEKVAPKVHTERHSDLDSLVRRLRQPRNRPGIAVLLAGSGQHLDEILSVEKLLRDLRIIIVLPDNEKETISKGHTLRPRLLTYIHSDFEEVGAVLRKMLGAHGSDAKCSKAC